MTVIAITGIMTIATSGNAKLIQNAFTTASNHGEHQFLMQWFMVLLKRTKNTANNVFYAPEPVEETPEA